MKAPRAPRIDERRTPEFLAEMEERARAWIPSWGLTDGEGDFGRALLEIAARFNSEVSECLDGAGEKMRRGFLDWLAVRGEAARPARMPVVFKLADTAQEGVLASAPVRMQAVAAGTPVVFETEEEVRIVPGQLDVVVGIDADNDAFFLPPPGLSDLKPLEALPTQWQLKSFAAAGVISFQLDPEAGLLPDTIIEAGNQQYQIVKVDKDLVTIDRPLVNAIGGGSVVTKVTTFSPFDGRTYNQQQHALYLGDADLLNIETSATIAIVGASALGEGFTWQYWGKLGDNDEVGWQELKLAKEQDQPDALVLEKPKGPVEQLEIAGKKSRWIRAYRKTVPSSAEPFTNDRVGITINSEGCKVGQCPPPKPPPDKPAVGSPEVEAMANITPLSLTREFFPLGKEPRQFDAFYLGSKEAFSKPGAKVQLCFQMADPTFAGLSCLRVPPLANQFLAGVAADSFLHLLSFDSNASVTRFLNREPVRPPSPKLGGETLEAPGIGLDIDAGFRAPIWVEGGNRIFIAVTAKNAVWIWCEDPPPNQAKSGWESAGSIGPAESPIGGLVHLAKSGTRGLLFAVQDKKLYVRKLTNNANATWEEVTRSGAGPAIEHLKIVSIGVTGVDVGGGVLSEGLVAVDTGGAVYGVQFPLTPVKATYKVLLTGVDVNVAPAAVRRNATDNRLVVVAVAAATGASRELLGFLSKPTTFFKDKTDNASLDSSQIVGRFLDVNVNNGDLTFVTCTKIEGESTSLAAWSPFILGNPTPAVVYSTKIRNEIGTAGGSPTLLEKHVVVPTTSSQILLAPFDTALHLGKRVKLRTAIIASTTADELQLNDNVFIPFNDAGKTKYEKKTFLNVPDEVARLGGRTLYDFDVDSKDAPFFVYRSTVLSFTGTVNPLHLKEITTDPNDQTTQGSMLLITTDASTQLYEVALFDQVNHIATLVRPLDIVNTANSFTYLNTTKPDSEMRPLLRLDPAPGMTGDWDAALLDRVRLAFPNTAEPNVQVGTAFRVDPTNRPILVALGQHWETHPQYETPVNLKEVTFVVDASVGDWSLQLGDTLTNPDLSWEYWNGTAWSLLKGKDSTENLKKTGNLTFDVATDAASSDWAGKTNFWIRARLIGGDYGREKVTVITKNVLGGTQQTISRSTEGIRPPKVLNLYISYALCKPVLPTFVLAEDSGTVRDQSDANRTQGAIVEAFVPLALTFGRLAKRVASKESGKPVENCFPADDVEIVSPEPKAEDCPECDCETLKIQKTTSSSSTAGATELRGTRITGREIYIGLAATLSEAPVNVLLLVNEQTHTKYAPMSIEALSADRFVPIVADDATRALGESGVLSMTFAVQPTRSELFGKKNLTWLRLIPKQADSNWIPTLRGAYLNAAWASATETLTRELLGSSDGSPNLTVFLARPPVLRKTLELRVKEPLGDEERKELLKLDSKSVLSAVDGLPGDWVLWKQVIDPDDEPETARVYALDETSGEVRFGDGRRGKIPPSGRDSIVAFSYARTEPDPTGGDSVPGNKIAPRTALNLVSPVETVESVIAADQAAGGAPPESDERVLRFGFARLRHRRRAVTAEDLEDLTLQSLPDIAQARAFVRRGYIRLVVVMRGKNPLPNAAQIRELRRLLLDAAPASLSAPKVLRIEGPGIRRLRIELQLLVDSLDQAGQLSSSVKKKIGTFFDTATGGLDKDGWALGANPSEEDIALAISDAPYLESIENVNLYEITEDGRELPLAAPGPREIVMLADDPIRIQFETAEAMV